jgi:hypothetical protein
LSLGAVAITAMLVAGFAFTAPGASAADTHGVWTVRPGFTLHLIYPTIEASQYAGGPWDDDTAYVDVDGVRIEPALATTIGSGNGGAHPPDYFYTNTDTKTHTVTLELYDSTPGHVCDSFSDGQYAFASTGGRYRVGLFAIHDGSLGCPTTSAPFGNSEFFGNVQVTR